MKGLQIAIHKIISLVNDWKVSILTDDFFWEILDELHSTGDINDNIYVEFRGLNVQDWLKFVVQSKSITN